MKTLSRPVAALAATATALILLPGVASAQETAPPAPVVSCYLTGQGQVRVISPADSCKTNELRLELASWTDLVALTNALAAESAARVAGDEALGKRIDDETAARVAALAAERAARIAGDEALGERIDGESAARTAADAALDGRLTDVEDNIGDLDLQALAARVAALEGQVDALEADYGAFKSETITVVNGLLSRFGGVTDVGGAIDSATKELESFFNSTFKDIEDAFQPVVNAFETAFKPVVDAFSSPQAFGDALKNLFNL